MSQTPIRRRHPGLQEEDKKDIVLVCLAYFVRDVWTALPNYGPLIKPFPLAPEVELHLSTYVWIGSIWSAMLILCYIIKRRRQALFWNMIFWMQVSEFVEYWVSYNDPIFWEINISRIRLVLILGLGSYRILKWK